MLEAIANSWQVEISNYPVLLIQAAALLGIISMILLWSRASTPEIVGKRAIHGIIFGITGLLMMAVAQPFFNQTSKPYLSSDLLFLAGLFGGFKGGGITLALMLFGRFAFGGLHQWEAVLIDMAFMTVAGSLLHRQYRSKSYAQLRGRDVLVLWTVRILCSIASGATIAVLRLVPPEVSMHVMTLQFFGFGISLFIIGSTVALLRFDALLRESHLQQMQLEKRDFLSGLPNKRALSSKIDSLLVDTRHQHAMIIIEIDNLKQMVSKLGHGWTDGFWGYLAGQISETGFDYARDNGDECYQFSDLAMAFILKNFSVQDIEDKRMIVKMHAILLEHFSSSNTPYQGVQLRYGVINLRRDGENTSLSTLRNASLAIQSNTAQIRYFHQSFSEQLEREDQVRGMIIEWIKTNSPPLFYQPKFDLKTRKMCGAEALLRAPSSDNQYLPPPYVFDVASQYQLALKLEWCTIEAVVNELVNCLSHGLQMPLSVNISAESMTVPGFGMRVCEDLLRKNVPAALLSLEITETRHLPNIQTVSDNIDALQHAGVRLSLDDFGSGYSALTVLARIPFNEVKIDYGMVSLIHEPRMQKAIALAYESARQYGAILVAEGVESEDQVELLLNMGVRFGQGYLFSKAKPIQDIIPIYGSNSISVG